MNKKSNQQDLDPDPIRSDLTLMNHQDLGKCGGKRKVNSKLSSVHISSTLCSFSETITVSLGGIPEVGGAMGF